MWPVMAPERKGPKNQVKMGENWGKSEIAFLRLLECVFENFECAVGFGTKN